ncbi:hypothetical protein TRFO_14486 [Tritrichomonas foetus]|uniref:Cache domain-containing protein n=1 Tax=Tritrichomonas foetus TaxID=1144522 RepID=A0A1J4KV64_9EUKA|nr:hypothetical protein TRFO_14486 [Tritrichomonas foetus]|eukprot:OHT15123.1 hypothetical protein TRFO_14486 [Tritrichomonas foetus]
MELIQLFPQFYPTTFPLIINSIERPLYGSESTTQHSDTVFNIMKNHPFNIIHYKKKIKAVTNLIFIVSLVVLVVAIFIPWMHSRKIAESTIQFLSNQQILAFSSTVTKSIEDVMTKYELISNFLASLFNDPDIIRCTDDQTVHLIKYVTTASKKLLPKPHQYSETTLIGDLRFCQIDFQEQQTEKFNLFYLYDNNSLDSNVHIREFHQDTDFTIWKPFTDGTHLIDIPKTSVNKSTFLMKQKITHWKYDKSFFDSPQHTQQHMSAVTPIINSSSHQVGLASVSLMTEDISKLIDNHIEESINCKYALLTKDMTVVITSDLGVIKPLRYEGNSPIYPDMKNLNSSFWAKLADKTRFTYNANSPIVVGEKAFQIEIDKVDYLVSISSVNPRNRTITHFFVVAISYNDIIGSAYFELAKGVVFITSVLFLIFYFILWCMKKNHIKRDNRLMKQKPILNSPYNTKMYIDDQGIIGRAIQQVRQLQLLFPEEINFNHVLDETVENLCKQRQKAYETARNSHCLFCNHVVKPKKTHNSNSDYFDTAQKDSFYLIWKKMEFPKIKYKFFTKFPSK